MKFIKLLLIAVALLVGNFETFVSSHAMEIKDVSYDIDLIKKQKVALLGVLNSQIEQIRYLEVVVKILTSNELTVDHCIDFLNGFHTYSWAIHWKAKKVKSKSQSKQILNKLYPIEQKKYCDEASRIYRGYLLSRLLLQNEAKSLLTFDITTDNVQKFQENYHLYILEIQRARTTAASHIDSIKGVNGCNEDFLQEELLLLTGMQQSLINVACNKSLNIKIHGEYAKETIEKFNEIHENAQQPGLNGLQEAKAIVSTMHSKVKIIKEIPVPKNWCHIIDKLFLNDGVEQLFPALSDKMIFEHLLSDLFFELSSTSSLITEKECHTFMKVTIPQKIENIKKHLYPPIKKKPKKKDKGQQKKTTNKSKKQEGSPAKIGSEFSMIASNSVEKIQEQEIITKIEVPTTSENIETPQEYRVAPLDLPEGKWPIIKNPKYLREQEKINNRKPVLSIQSLSLEIFKPEEIIFFDTVLFSPLSLSNTYCWNDIISFLSKGEQKDRWKIKTSAGSKTQFTPPGRLHDIFGSHHITVHAAHNPNKKPMPVYCIEFLQSGFKDSYGLIQLDKGIYTTRKKEEHKN